jgi:DNA-binding ferritin-like protein
MEQLTLFIGTLLQSRNQAHIYHWQVTGPGSHAAHKALGKYYEEIIGKIDDLVESIQGRYGIIRGYKMASSLREDNNFITYFEALCKFVETTRNQIPQDSYIQNQVDEIVKLIESTKYKLENLQ